MSNLFYKYEVKIANKNDDIEYDIIKQSNIVKDTVCLIHCYNLSLFEEIFGDYLNNLNKYFSVIVTFSKGNTIPNFDFTFIKVKNKGRDIGGFISSLDFLYKNNKYFKYVLFLHSKSDKKSRLQYFEPLIRDEMTIIKNLLLLSSYDAIFNGIHNDPNEMYDKYASNIEYHREILDFLNVSDKRQLEFSEGNCMFLTRKIIDFIFKDNLKIFYNILNSKIDFDVNWVKIKFNKRNIPNIQLFNDFLKNKSYLNLNGNSLAVGNNFGNDSNSTPDGMVEHVFERIYINILNHLNSNYLVVK